MSLAQFAHNNVLIMEKLGKTWGFFDEACQGTLGTCGVGVILFFVDNHYIC
jgi:hypothetical protein